MSVLQYTRKSIRKFLFQILPFLNTLLKMNFYRRTCHITCNTGRTFLIIRSTLQTGCTNFSTYLSTHSACLSNRSMYLSIRLFICSICPPTRIICMYVVNAHNSIYVSFKTDQLHILQVFFISIYLMQQACIITIYVVFRLVLEPCSKNEITSKDEITQFLLILILTWIFY